MRPLRFLLLLGFFVVLPVILTCVSLLTGKKSSPETLNIGYRTRTSRFRALFSFSTPSSLFPPSAIITLTDDNSTSFLARPAAFGPSLPLSGLNGQLWVGKGFGEDMLLSEEQLRFSGFELGCSDVPGWNDDHKKRPENGAISGKIAGNMGDASVKVTETQPESTPSKRDGSNMDEFLEPSSQKDGTDDHLHYPLPDSNPASSQKLGEPATTDKQDKSKPPTHADIESMQESADIAGKIVMLSRGGCGFLEKVKWAQRRGGIAVIVGDNEPGGQLTVMYAKGDTSNVTIPSIFTSYYSAHLLSTLVPPEEKVEIGKDGKPIPGRDGKTRPKDKTGDRKGSTAQKMKAAGSSKVDASSDSKAEKGWVQNVLSAVGLEDGENLHTEDSRRPPGSGNIDWILQKEWDDDKIATTSSSTQTQKAVKSVPTPIKGSKPQTTLSKKVENDDFVIGVQDWRDTELIAPKPTNTQGSKKQKGKAEAATSQSSSFTSSANPTVTALRGGSITPGSGEYDHQADKANSKLRQSKTDTSENAKKHSSSHESQSLGQKIAAYFRHAPPKEIIHPRPDERFSTHEAESGKEALNEKADHKIRERHGLWVTLTPASPSTSPFFDTLLVLVVSPLVTLTFVYGLLLLRSRIRRRRWRAPKSIVERLPVRTYHTMSSTSSATSSSLPSPQPSLNSSPTLRPSTHIRTRPRSQTTTGVLSSSSSAEKAPSPPSPKRKRYTGRQVECVVCLEEYVDGESQVMSLPCGHEFHVDCITPWLVTRRRTCPICKGDVVRSLSRAGGAASNAAEDAREEDEETSDDVQDRAAMTSNSDSSAAIPIPVLEEGTMDDDIERGSDVDTPLLGGSSRVQHGRWRGLLTEGINRLSGDTVWRSGENDRTR